MSRDDLENTVHALLRQEGIRPPFSVAERDYLCLIAYSYGVLLQTAAEYSGVEKMHFVVSQKRKVSEHIKECHEDLRSKLESPYREMVGDLLPRDMKNEPALQPADVLCWHFQRYFLKMMDSIDEGRLWRFGQTNGILHENTSSDLGEVGERLAGRVRFNVLLGDYQG